MGELLHLYFKNPSTSCLQKLKLWKTKTSRHQFLKCLILH